MCGAVYKDSSPLHDALGSALAGSPDAVERERIRDT